MFEKRPGSALGTVSMIAAVANTDRGQIEVDGIAARIGLDREVACKCTEECSGTAHSCVVARSDTGRSSCRRRIV